MRALLTATFILILIVSTWGVFIHHVDDNIHLLIDIIEEDIEVNLEQPNWPGAYAGIKKLSEEWHDQKKVYAFFFSTLDMNEADYALAKAKSYISTENLSLAAGELANLKEQLKFLHSNELITLENLL